MPKHLLLVDDDKDILSFYEESFELYFPPPEFKIICAVDGESGLEIIAKNKEIADSLVAVVVDGRMPGMDGPKVARTLRKNGYNGVIVLCSSDAKYGRDFKKYGIDNFFIKGSKEFPKVIADYIKSEIKKRSS